MSFDDLLEAELDYGFNTFEFTVRAKDGNGQKVYRFVVLRHYAADARLSGLTLSDIDFAPSFDSGEFAYAADVPITVTSTTVTPVRSNSDATAVIKLNGVEDTDGTVSLAVGENVITVEVTAEGGNTTGTYTVIVTRNNAEPAFSDTATTRTLPENSAAGTDVDGGAVTATDTDSGDTLTYGLKNTGDYNSFTIVPSSGQIQAKSGVVYNFEGSKTSYTVTVTVHDGKDPVGGASTVVDDEIVVTIDLTDVNEAPTFTSGPTSRNVSENSTSVATHTASDPDASDTLTWSVEGADDGSFFEISSDGVLSFSTAPDFEDKQDADANNVYNVTVKVSDGPLEDTQAVAITVTTWTRPGRRRSWARCWGDRRSRHW